MKKLWMALAAVFALSAAAPAFASNPGDLTVRDNAKLFSAEGIKAAKDAFAAEKFDSPTHILVVTHEGMPEKRKAEFDKLKDKPAKDAFIGTWVREDAKAEGAHGIFVMISANPNYLRVISSEQMRANRSFGNTKDERMQDHLLDAFKASAKLTGAEQKAGRDAGLLKAVEYAREQLKGTSTVSSTVSTTGPAKTRADKGGSGMSLLAWVCIIGVVLLGVWLVIGVIRALTGMGGGGGGYGGGGGMGGGGGGGFMSSLMGGMFGTMAGMWMYNSFFGGGMSSMSAGDYGGGGATGGDNGGGGTAAGDDANFDNGADGGGGDWGGGDAGGGDYGGGDFGGGDFGGGGGDFGGGGDW